MLNFSKVQKLNKVDGVNLDFKPVLILRNKGIELLEGTRIFEGSLISIIRSDHYLILNLDNEGNKVLLDLRSGSTEQFKTSMDGFDKFLSRSLVERMFYSDDYLKTYLGIFDLDLKANVWIEEFTVRSSMVHIANYIYCDTMTVKCRILDSGQFIWQQNFENFDQELLSKNKGAFEILSIHGTYNDQLILSVKGGVFIGLDLKTGAIGFIKHEVDENLTAKKIEGGFGNFTVGRIHRFENEILVLMATDICRFNLVTGKSQYVYSSEEEFGKNNFIFQKCIIVKEHLFFTAYTRDNLTNPDVIGVINLETNKMVWKQKIDLEPGEFFTDIKATENQIFGHTSKANLYILEKKVRVS